jgi:hypothetical protein
MTALPLLLIVLAAQALAVSVGAFLVRRAAGPESPQTASDVDVLMRDRLKERFVVTAVSGEAFAGLLIDVDDRTVVLRDVSVLKADGAQLPVDGELVLRRDAIAYMQRP